ncbi:hypothetical protein X975_23913, partial [Stegodyphus mimosarum]
MSSLPFGTKFSVCLSTVDGVKLRAWMLKMPLYAGR